MENPNDDYNQRQYKLMLNEINEYKSGKSNLGKLVSNLEALNSGLRSPSGTWQKEFQSAWWPLEEVYAMSRSDELLSEVKSQEVIAKSLDELAALMNAKKS